jgi:thiol-disulfide isomerase/thioredoxin
MHFLHITPEKSQDLTMLNNYIDKGYHVFILIYKNGCPPCEATKPEWFKIEEVLKTKYSNKKDVVVAAVEQSFSDKVNGVGSIDGFPTIVYIKNGKKQTYEDSGVKNKDRSKDSFIEWIESKIENAISVNEHIKFEKELTKAQNGGKKHWSLKYKRSINCRRPKGFSQKQYCKKRNTKRRTKRHTKKHKM